ERKHECDHLYGQRDRHDEQHDSDQHIQDAGQEQHVVLKVVRHGCKCHKVIDADDDHCQCGEILDHGENAHREYSGQHAGDKEHHCHDKVCGAHFLPSSVPGVDQFLYIIKV